MLMPLSGKVLTGGVLAGMTWRNSCLPRYSLAVYNFSSWRWYLQSMVTVSPNTAVTGTDSSRSRRLSVAGRRKVVECKEEDRIAYTLWWKI